MWLGIRGRNTFVTIRRFDVPPFPSSPMYNSPSKSTPSRCPDSFNRIAGALVDMMIPLRQLS